MSEYVDENIRMVASEIDKVFFSEGGAARAQQQPGLRFGQSLRTNFEEPTAAFCAAFLVELAANAAALGWLVAGSSWVSAGTDAYVDSAPFLWYSCYLMVVFIWSLLGTMTTGLIASAVATVLPGSKS
ncbi:unnamed protein product [Polarella glacialis]|uniref:Uncharacterized protein n=1 Tax=Polarella glacialis TaxID=89957 RepID=A0A813G3E2_POLGL|nr:unnamed protein product [Polarella glacialis]